MARRLEATLCTAIGIKPGQVERLRWVDEAMSRAVAAGVLAAPDDGMSNADQLGLTAPPGPAAAG